MQERVGLAAFDVIHFPQCRIDIGKVGMVFRMLGNPLACYCFKSFQRLA